MRRLVGQDQEERLRLRRALAEPVDGVLRQQVRDVAGPLEGLAVLVELRIEVHALALEAEPVIESGPRHVRVGVHVPLADERGLVPRGLQDLRIGGDARRQLHDLVHAHAVGVRIEPGEKRGPARRAEGRRHRGAVELDAARREPLEVAEL
jgi:hypothetical protein